MNKLNYVLKTIAVSLFFLASPAVAEGIPASMLLKEKAECKQECALNGNNEMVCETLCSCTVEQFKKLDLSEFQDMKAQLDAGSVSVAMQGYLANVGAMCVAELDNVVDGLPKPSLP